MELKCGGGVPKIYFPFCKGFDVFKCGPSVHGPTVVLLLIHFEREDVAFELLNVIQGDLLEGRTV